MSVELSEQIISAEEKHLDEILKMALDLWPDQTDESLRGIFRELLASEKFKILLFRLPAEYVAFLYLAVRTDYVEGSEKSPTGYIEGIYVKPAYRRRGISRKLLEVGEQWVKEKGCTQIGSDTYPENKVSYDFHTRVGFKEASRIITFIKDL